MDEKHEPTIKIADIDKKEIDTQKKWDNLMKTVKRSHKQNMHK